MLSAPGKALRAFIQNAVMPGTSPAPYARNLPGKVMDDGRAGTLMDWESGSGNCVPASLFTAESILNDRLKRIRGRTVHHCPLRDACARQRLLHISSALLDSI